MVRTTIRLIGTTAVFVVLVAGPSSARDDAWQSLHDEGWSAYQKGDLAAALPKLRAAAEASRAFPADDPRTATSYDHLAWALAATGRGDEAEPLARWALARREATLGPEHPDVATSLNTVACLLDASGRVAEAEPMFRRALAIEEKTQGPDNPNLAGLLDNLAIECHLLGKHAEAEALYRRAIAIREKASGNGEAATGAELAPSLHNLAALLLETGRHDEAEPHLKRALGLREAELGPNHPDVAATLTALAHVEHARGRHDSSETLYRRALAILDASGQQVPHQVALPILEGYAAALRATDRHDEARPLIDHALRLRTGPMPPAPSKQR